MMIEKTWIPVSNPHPPFGAPRLETTVRECSAVRLDPPETPFNHARFSYMKLGFMVVGGRKLSAHIIVVSHHNDEDLRLCLPELARTIGDCPVTIVDNAPSNGALDWVGELYPDWQLKKNPVNLGFGQANNVAAFSSQSDYLVFLNPDTLPTENWLDELLRPLDEVPSVGLTTAKIILLSEPNLLNTAGNAVHLSGLTTCRGVREPLESFSRQEQVGAVSGACFAIRRELYEALHGFDEMFFMYMEDTDLSLRAIIKGYEIAYVPTSRVYHDYELKFVNQKIFYQERNRYLMMYKLFKVRTLILLVPPLLLGEIVSWSFVLIKERSSIGNKLRAYDWILKNRKLLQMRRREVQSSRVLNDRQLLGHFDSRLDITQFGRTLVNRFAENVLKTLTSVYRSLLLWIIRW
jgi:GT2 family glycosyltransferase